MRALATPPEQPLGQWLRLLWNTAPPLHLHPDHASDPPFIAAGALHLPTQAHWQQHCAAAAHAAAHLVYSPPRFAADGLVPTARVLLALLEDARAEALAMRELPGLARLWRPLHTATPASGMGCEALLARLARALIDPAYTDPHPWVAKGRQLFYLDQQLGLPALHSPAALRTAAMRLGHAIGQLRLPFNAKGYRPAPAYRDDHRWMWPAEQLAAVRPPPSPQPTPADALHHTDVPPQPTPSHTTLHPEWDRLIQRLRPAWARVVEQVPLSPRLPIGVPAQGTLPNGPVLAALRSLARQQAHSGRSTEGEHLHTDALLAWAAQRRSGQAGDLRVYRARPRQTALAAQVAVWVLVDQSASTGAALSAHTGSTVLQAAGQAALGIAQALHTLGIRCAVAAFSSNGRHAVQVRLLQPLAGATVAQRGDHLDQLRHHLQALQPTGSTRLGAALRHATLRLAETGAQRPWVLLVSDGQPHDVDMHHPQDLVDDARHAVLAARRRGVRMACLTLASSAGPQALRIFGPGGTQPLHDLHGLPRALRCLVA